MLERRPCEPACGHLRGGDRDVLGVREIGERVDRRVAARDDHDQVVRGEGHAILGIREPRGDDVIGPRLVRREENVRATTELDLSCEGRARVEVWRDGRAELAREARHDLGEARGGGDVEGDRALARPRLAARERGEDEPDGRETPHPPDHTNARVGDLALGSEKGQTRHRSRATKGPMTSRATTHLDARACHRALSARDARFDGSFFVGVSTTGVYCRPICPARTPRADRCRYFSLAAEAEREGFRACFRCRPELAPGAAPVDARSRLVAAALTAIERGALEREGVEALARRLGVTSRHLRRTLERELGVTPIELETTRRLGVAKQLLTDTALPLARIAFGSGFGSVRRFNAAFATRFARRPTEVRREHSARDRAEELVLRLDHRAPFDWPALLAFVAPRAIPGVERAVDGVYERAVRVGADEGWIRARPWAGRSALRLEVSLSLASHVAKLARSVRDLFDLDAHPDRIASALSSDRLLAPLVRARPGLRVPGALDPFEIAVRSVLAQQVSLAAATTLSGRLAHALGRAVRTGLEGLDRAFPDAAAIAAWTPAAIATAIGMPLARGRALHALAEAVASGVIDLSGARPSRELVSALEELPGIGPFTSEVIAMRALRDADAFPANDLVIARRLGKHALARAEAFRPYRAYAALHLWTDEGARR